jgi:sortase (surface protein transpeptidase)
MLNARRVCAGRLTAGLIATIVLAACANAQASGGKTVRRPSPVASTSPPDSAQAADQLRVPAPLFDPSVDLRAGPVPVPLELRIPSLQISAPVLGVGLTAKNVMDAPTGSARDSVWQKVFWYRGGGIPGDATTATIAGHVDDVLGRPAIFARLKDLRPGDPIVVRDLRTGLDADFVVRQTISYTLRQTLDSAVLSLIYGPGPVAGQWPEPSSDGLSHLTLITCTGNWVGSRGTFDHRLVVYAVSLPLPRTPRERHSLLMTDR